MLSSNGCHLAQFVAAITMSQAWTDVALLGANSGKVGAFADAACSELREWLWEYNLLSTLEPVDGHPNWMLWSNQPRVPNWSGGSPLSSYIRPILSQDPTRNIKQPKYYRRIPPTYSLEDWDPTYSPEILLASIFDGNSHGKWIYDSTICHDGSVVPTLMVADDLRLLLVEVTSKESAAVTISYMVSTLSFTNDIASFIISANAFLAQVEKNSWPSIFATTKE